MNTRSIAACSVLLGLSWACHDGPGRTEPAPSQREPAPDRLAEGEQLPEAEIAFGLPLPKGMRVIRHFKSSAYIAGDVKLPDVLEHLQKYVLARDAEMQGEGAVFPRAHIAGDETQRLLRIEATQAEHGSQIYIEDITPPPPRAELTGLTQAEIWRLAGRNPDGSLIDPNQQY